ncbi:MAG: U32 family peptidase [Bacilli bacterium]|nr:U32 family peptidase [Bacilli bacterium]
MLKIATEVIDWNHLTDYEADVIIVGSQQFGLYAPTNLSQEAIKEAISLINKSDKAIALRVDRIMQEDDLEELRIFLQDVVTKEVDYVIFSDMAVYSLLQKQGFSRQFIFNAKTLNCSLNDAKYYQSLGIDVLLSHELPCDDIVEITKAKNVCLEGYSHSLIFYSYRQLISSYYEKYSLDTMKEVKNLTIREQNTKGLYNVIENEHGTFIYQHQRYAIFYELPLLQDVKLLMIQPHFMEEQELRKSIRLYRTAILHGPTHEGYEALLKCYPLTDSGFLYRKPMILEEGQDEKN